MIMEQRVKNAINIFIKAIDKRTLAKGDCAACAVGNLVASGMGGVITKKCETDESFDIFDCNVDNWKWKYAFYTDCGYQEIDTKYFNNPEVLANIQSTEFSLEELAKIEYAFETNTKINNQDYTDHSDKEVLEDQIKGLEAVIEVMLKFSGDNTTDVKKEFTNKIK